MISSLCVVIRWESAFGVPPGPVLAWGSYIDSAGWSSEPEDRPSVLYLVAIRRLSFDGTEVDGSAEMKMYK